MRHGEDLPCKDGQGASARKYGKPLVISHPDSLGMKDVVEQISKASQGSGLCDEFYAYVKPLTDIFMQRQRLGSKEEAVILAVIIHLGGMNGTTLIDILRFMGCDKMMRPRLKAVSARLMEAGLVEYSDNCMRNPLMFPMVKYEGGWPFASKREEELICRQFNRNIQKFFDTYPSDVTIVVPSCNTFNLRLVKDIVSQNPGTILNKGFVRRMTTEEVDDIVTAFGSKFRQIYLTEYEFNNALNILYGYLDKMDEEREGYFTRDFINNAKLREAVDVTLKLTDDTYARYAKKLTDRNVLIIDDTISRGDIDESIINDNIKTIKDTYAPKSITVLTLKNIKGSSE